MIKGLLIIYLVSIIIFIPLAVIASKILQTIDHHQRTAILVGGLLQCICLLGSAPLTIKVMERFL